MHVDKFCVCGDENRPTNVLFRFINHKIIVLYRDIRANRTKNKARETANMRTHWQSVGTKEHQRILRREWDLQSNKSKGRMFEQKREKKNKRMSHSHTKLN